MNELKEVVKKEYEFGISPKTICDKYGISKSTLYNWLRENKVLCVRDGAEITVKDYYILQKMYNRLKLEAKIYEKLHCFKDAGNKEKEVTISKFVGVYPIHIMCKVLNLPKGTFYNYHFRRKEVTQYKLRDEELKKQIMKIYTESERRFGAKKIMIKLQMAGVGTTLNKVQKLMTELNIQSIQKLRRKEKQGRSNVYYSNKLKRMFKQDEPNKFWVSDVTEVKVGLTKFYLCVILDLFSRKVIAYKLSSQNNTKLTTETFKDAFESRNRPSGLSFHSDRGANYTSTEFRDLLCVLKVNQSFSHAGNPYDNACMESFFSNFKREEYNAKEYEFFEDLENGVSSYVRYYNEYRPHQTLDNKTPNQFEEEYYNSQSAKITINE